MEMIGYPKTEKVNVAWTANEIFILKLEWEKGTNSAVIGNMLGRNRNSVIGKAHRMLFVNPRSSKLKENRLREPKLNLKRLKNKKEQNQRYWEKAKLKEANIVMREKRKSPMKIPVCQALPGQNPIGIMDLKENTCRAVIGPTGRNVLSMYCGDEVFPGKSYCPAHNKMFTYLPPPGKRRIYA